MKFLIGRLITGFILIFLMSSCALKEAIENGFGTTTSVAPLASSETLAERYGDGKYISVSIKVPLTEDSVGYFDIDDVLGNTSVSTKNKNYFSKLYDSFKLAMYNIFVGFGASNKIKYSSVFEFPEIDPQYIKKARVKKVFFTTEDCRPEEESCDDLDSLGSNFNFVDTFFVNISHPDLTRDDESVMEDLSQKEFRKIRDFSFNQTKESMLTIMNQDEDYKGNKQINIVKFHNTVPFINLDRAKYIERNHYIYFEMQNDKRLVAKYLNGKSFSKLIRRVEHRRRHKGGVEGSYVRDEIRGLRAYLRKGISAEQVFAKIKTEQSVLARKMYIFRLNGDPIKAKKYFKNSEFGPLIKDLSLIGRSLFVELKSETLNKRFKELLVQEEEELERQKFIYKVEKCSNTNCVDLPGTDINLVPLLERNPRVLLDTYLSVRSLSDSDFKYNGFVEIEVTLDLPL